MSKTKDDNCLLVQVLIEWRIVATAIYRIDRAKAPRFESAVISHTLKPWQQQVVSGFLGEQRDEANAEWLQEDDTPEVRLQNFIRKVIGKHKDTITLAEFEADWKLNIQQAQIPKMGTVSPLERGELIYPYSRKDVERNDEEDS
jgi:hypothetical protein